MSGTFGNGVMTSSESALAPPACYHWKGNPRKREPQSPGCCPSPCRGCPKQYVVCSMSHAVSIPRKNFVPTLLQCDSATLSRLGV